MAASDALATAATIDHVACVLWNPHASKSIYVREVHVFSRGATIQYPSLIRCSTAGTGATSTVTPDNDNAFDRRANPPSGALIYGGTFNTTQPTLQQPYMARTALPAAIGAAVMWSFLDAPIEVPTGTGIAIATPVATALQANSYSFVWDE
jgi:hypothetical protein